MNFFQGKISVFILFSGVSIGLQALEQSTIMQRAQLIKLVDERNVAQFKEQLSYVVQQCPQENRDIVDPVVDYIKMTQAQKTAQLAHNSGKSRKIAAAKAAFCGLLSVSAVAAQLGLCNDWLNSLVWFVHGDKVPEGKSAFQLFAYFHYLCIPSLAYLSISWTYENAQFARYGDSLLLSDICILDDMLRYAQSIA